MFKVVKTLAYISGADREIFDHWLVKVNSDHAACLFTCPRNSICPWLIRFPVYFHMRKINCSQDIILLTGTMSVIWLVEGRWLHIFWVNVRNLAYAECG